MHAAALDTYRHRGQRRALVEELRRKGIGDERVLAAIGAVPRHLFFERAFESHAYQDKAFPIGEGQTISQPYTVAYQTELLHLSPGQRVLEVGTGSGYQCAVLLALGVEVWTIEYNRVLFERTRQRLLEQFQYRGAQLFCGDGSVGLPAHAPFDRILVTAAAPALPRPLLRQLCLGGRLVVPVGDEQVQRMVRVTRESAEGFAQETFEEFRFVPLRGAAGWAG
ncbi:protein-L-isoaspartate(D-aspartate) O-methyltransferase [Hymenobacter busanensis]|uniref:Protein-L-isoaspartate O-methyltransferase n=1 Tax=Hymenobacter busanensis TaxID=2607656 RepID=A0A7L4ZU15_9BACT|nr:protein-L-isoaspartate(D-aspartate) O-methyltransferase [Hymenobacter busanensis]KAA9325845.1 protein-L-isoaspartate(D-aspartate) O-methyltransferase [Hymenobacter busanensis]QHJ06315.1 protein-L-isoaspartate(D-aspartate) O-methyltransferase [Hymenobacter busanensis]